MVFAPAQKVPRIFLEGVSQVVLREKSRIILSQIGPKGAIFEIFKPVKSNQHYAYGI